LKSRLLTAAALLAGTVLLFVYGYLSSPNPKPPASPSAARPDASLLTRSPELSSADPASAASAPPATTAQSPLEAAIDRVLALLERRAGQNETARNDAAPNGQGPVTPV